MKDSLVTFGLLAVVQGLPHQQVPLGYPTQRQNPLDASFDKLAEHALKEFQVPGFSVAVIKGNDTFAKGYGFAELPDKKATADTLYFTGSTAKSFTAASILQLIEKHEDISLDSKIEDFISWKLQDDYAQTHATLEDALSHRTGMPRHDLSYGGPNFTDQDMIDSLQYLPLTKELRQGWQYCNMMFIVLSSIIEKLSGSTLAKYLKTHIWEPLGMSNTFMDLDAAKATGSLAMGYYYDNTTKKYLPHDYQDPVFLAGAGGIISSVSDYAKYLRAVMHEDPALLGLNSYRQLKTARMITPPFLSEELFTGPVSYGLGWMFSVYNGYEVIHHSGGVPGFATNMLYVPERDWAVVSVTNADVGGSPVVLLATFELLDRELGEKKRPDVSSIWSNMMSIRLMIMKQLRSIAFPEAPPPDRAIPHALPLDAYTGSFFNPGYRHVNITLAQPTTYVGIPVPSEDGMILHADATDKTWKHVLDFEHVNAEHFLVRYHFDTKDAKNFDLETEAMRAEFEIDSAGGVARLGLGYEPSMGFDNLIWFDRVTM